MSDPAIHEAFSPKTKLGKILSSLEPAEYRVLLGAMGLDQANIAKFEQVLGVLEKAGVIRQASGLTPVNAALGDTIGKLLDGKKTVIGVVLMIASVLFPQYGPIISLLSETASGVAQPIAEGAGQASKGGGIGSILQGVMLPVASLLTGWGALGKIDKWMHKPSVTTIADIISKIGK